MPDLYLLCTACTNAGEPVYVRPHGFGLTTDKDQAWRGTKEELSGYYIYGTEELERIES